ncbi:MAG: hypothetical protein HQL30_09115 [Candidatus Omnitrophica bacterium]|nr:hypothetical protein [Candidatus Omnitrophota bacterium]
MNRKIVLKCTLIAGLFFISIGGWLLHLRIHPPTKDTDFYIPFIAGILSAFCLPLLFCFRRTIALAYIINGFLVMIGTITMAQFSIVNFKGPVTLTNIILTTLFADIAMLWGKFTIGKAIFDLESLKSDADRSAQGRFLRYPHMGWWLIHLFALSLVYALGNILWK